MNSWFAPNSNPRIIAKGKAADETINDSAVLQDDDDLFFPIGANEIWAFTLILVYVTSAAADLKYGFTAPTGATGAWEATQTNPLAHTDFSTPDTEFVLGTDATVRMAMASGAVVNGSTAGTFQLQWTQNAQTASDTTVKAGSHLIATRVA